MRSRNWETRRMVKASQWKKRVMLLLLVWMLRRVNCSSGITDTEIMCPIQITLFCWLLSSCCWQEICTTPRPTPGGLTHLVQSNLVSPGLTGTTLSTALVWGVEPGFVSWSCSPGHNYLLCARLREGYLFYFSLSEHWELWISVPSLRAKLINQSFVIQININTSHRCQRVCSFCGVKVKWFTCCMWKSEIKHVWERNWSVERVIYVFNLPYE